MKKIKSLYTFVLIFIILMSGCAAPVSETQVPVTETKELPTKTEKPTLEPTSTQKVEPTPTEIPTPTATSEPILWCDDVIEGCYFKGDEIARLFAFLTKTCFDLGGECFPPVMECDMLPRSVVHVLVDDFASAWEAEINGNPDYALLDPNLYDSQTEYCFVDEWVGMTMRESGLEDFQANKSCLDNENMPCDIVLHFARTICTVYDNYCNAHPENAYFTDKKFLVIAMLKSTGGRTFLFESLDGETFDLIPLADYFIIYTSTSAGFDFDKFLAPFGIPLMFRN